ncbi:efflux RND transporter periplasmic adaptor subunit, partial [bacterium]|nr:efflux RND transporter periplasmic adaptor subunit [bacterium]
TIVDINKMWAYLDILPADIAKVKVGQNTQISIPELQPNRFNGQITWIDSAISQQTRTLKVRVELDNSAGLLKSGMYGQAKITLNQARKTLLVHKDAVQWDGCCNVIFVKKNSTTFETKKVILRPAGKSSDYYVVEGNFLENDQVVTTGSFLLKTEILKGNIGAGCCEVKAGK